MKAVIRNSDEYSICVHGRAPAQKTNSVYNQWHQILSSYAFFRRIKSVWARARPPSSKRNKKCRGAKERRLGNILSVYIKRLLCNLTLYNNWLYLSSRGAVARVHCAQTQRCKKNINTRARARARTHLYLYERERERE
jgi:hypothetical protein